MISFSDIPVEGLLDPHIHPNDRDPDAKMFKALCALNYYGHYWQIGREHRPTAILEIGVRYGYSAICLLDGAGTNADYTGIDHQFFEGSNAYARSQIKQHTTGRVEIIDVDSRIVDKLPDRSFDLAHIDGSHKGPHVMSDLNLAGKHMLAGGLFIIDDAKVPEVYRAGLKWAAKRLYDVQSVPTKQGMLLIWKRSMASCGGRWAN